jgi:serine/threonine protein kinase/formylglycine-generating enzyme required for sulfatase activity
MPAPEPPLKFACPLCSQRHSLKPALLETSGGVLRPRCVRCRAIVEVRLVSGALRVRLEEAPPEGLAGEGGDGSLTTEADLGGPDVGTSLGRYRLEALLGRGGMGSVYRAYDPATNRRVALKVLPPGTPELDLLRFEREIQLQGNVHHPHILPIFDSGTEGGHRFYTMDLLRDPLPLAQLVPLVRSGEAARSARLKPLGTLRGVVERVILPMCDAVHHANLKEGVLHRDVTPTNVLVDGQDLRPYLIDFGVCTLLEAKNPHLKDLPSEASLSLSGGKRTVSGTLVYMPPEQIQGKADRRGDVWGLGALLHFLVTGEPPVAPAAHSTVPVAQRREGLTLLIEQAERQGDAAEAAEFRRKLADLEAGRERTREDVAMDVAKGVYKPRPAWVDPAFDAVIAKAMAVDPELRYRNAKELRQDLEAWLAGRPPLALAEQRGGTAHAIYASRQTLKRWRGPLAGAAALVALVVGVVLWRGASAERARETQVATARAALAAAKERADARTLLPSTLPDGGQVLPKPELVAEVERAAWALLDASPGDAEARAALDWCAQERHRLAGRAAVERALDAVRRADRAGDDAAAAAARAELRVRLLDVAADATSERWTRLLEDKRRVTLPELGSDVDARFHAVLPDGRLGDGRAARSGSNDLTPGRWVLAWERSGRRVHTPFELTRALERLEVAPATDPLPLPAGTVYVPGGRARGPLGETPVGAVVWEATEVTVERYAAWLATLGPEEQEQRVPREAGFLGGAGRPLWPRRDGRFTPPKSDLQKPVDAISCYDARAFAQAHARRLPSAQEWAWAATGPFGAVCALGPLERLFGPEACLGPTAASPRDVGTSAGDVSLFGVRDLAGNVAEHTSTLLTMGGESGWAVMGSGYGLAPERGRAAACLLVPGWRPLPGVGIRLVLDP